MQIIRLHIAALLGAIAVFGQAETQILTNQTVADMVHAKVAQDVIIDTICRARQFSFDLTPSALIYAAQASIPDDMVRAMAAKQNGSSNCGGVPAAVPISSIPQKRMPDSNSLAAGAVNPPPLSRTVGGSNGEAGLHRGAKEVGLAASAFVPHASASGSLGMVSGRFAYFPASGSSIGFDVTGFFTRGMNVAVFDGFSRYYMHTRGPVSPFFGGGAGVIAGSALGFTSSNFAAYPEAGLRVFVAPRIAVDFGYRMQYIHANGAGFKDSTLSIVTVGFANVF